MGGFLLSAHDWHGFLRMKSWIRRHRRSRKRKAAYRDWKRSGEVVPPPHLVKQYMIESLAKQFRLRVFVETGTYQGDMIDAMKDEFDRLYSIELSEDLYHKALTRFAAYKEKITLIHGDSGMELARVVAGLDQPALFWLDGHYSGGVTAKGETDTPILDELLHVSGSAIDGHVIMIDDARCFGSDPAYPAIDELRSFMERRWPGAHVHVAGDAIQIMPG